MNLEKKINLSKSINNCSSSFVNKAVDDPLKFSKFKTIKIFQLRNWDYFGDSLILAEIKSPVTLRVKSKEACILTLSKGELNNIILSFNNQLSESLYSSVHNIDILNDIIINKTNKKVEALYTYLSKPDLNVFSFENLSEKEKSYCSDNMEHNKLNEKIKENSNNNFDNLADKLVIDKYNKEAKDYLIKDNSKINKTINFNDSNDLLFKNNEVPSLNKLTTVQIPKKNTQTKSKMRDFINKIKEIKQLLQNKVNSLIRVNKTNNLQICTTESFKIKSLYSNKLTDELSIFNSKKSFLNAGSMLQSKLSKTDKKIGNNEEDSMKHNKYDTSTLSPKFQRTNRINKTNINSSHKLKQEGIKYEILLSPCKRNSRVEEENTKQTAHISNFSPLRVKIDTELLEGNRKSIQKNLINMQIQDKEERSNPKLFLESFLNRHLSKSKESK